MNGPVASIIVPCRNVRDTVEEALSGVLSSSLRELEVIAVDDGSTDGTPDVLHAIAGRDSRVKVLGSGGRGVSAARNVGLDAAAGEFIFFLDADDAVEPDFYPKAVAEMRRSGADYCRVAHDRTNPSGSGCSVANLKANYAFSSQEEIREKYLPCFFGYSFAQVRDWYGGAPLGANREMGGVVFGCFRANVIKSGGIRFDETVEIFEDAMFTCEYLLSCGKTAAIDEILYHYRLKASGSMISKLDGREFLENKLRLLAKRKAIDAKSGGKIPHLYAASCVFSLLEILRASLRTKGCFRLGLKTFLRYGRDPVVKAALRGFPLSWRKPALAASVLFCRLLFPASGSPVT